MIKILQLTERFYIYIFFIAITYVFVLTAIVNYYNPIVAGIITLLYWSSYVLGWLLFIRTKAMR